MKKFHERLTQLAKDSLVKKGWIFNTRFELPFYLNRHIIDLNKLIPKSTMVSDEIWAQVEQNITHEIGPGEFDKRAVRLAITTATAALVLAAARA